ncbi:hypothetical protein AB0D42_18570 [Streptomyces sp. NPDC048304]|uniref:hypothetical protein n=1 Tax=Streptomyces sp. NPDC048304 TaxID=3154820 RepID=UPI0033EAF16A
MAISVGSVEVDVIPSTRGVYQRLRQGLEPAASRVGDEVGRIVGRYIMAGVQGSIRDGLAAGARQAQAPAVRQGAQTGSAFARGFKTRLEAALRDLPEVRLHANSTDAEREIAQIRAQMQSLRDVRIGIDVSEADAVAAMDHLRERLARLSASDANVAIRVDAGAASAQLAAFQGELNRLDGQTADVDVDTHAATANLNAMTTAAIAFGPALIPVLPVVAAGLGAVAAAAAAAGAGIGGIALVAVPAFKQIAGVLQAQKSAQDAAATATANGGRAAAQASSRALQLASAQQAVATAERSGARQIAQAQQQVVQARQNAAQVAQQASLQSQQAARAVADAERALSAAQVAATQAQQNLTAARQQATRELQDMNNSLVDAQLAQKQAEFALADAKKQRDAVFANSSSTDDQRARAQLAYDQAEQALKEQQLQTQRLQKDTDAANKAGVKGSQTYKSAQDQLAQAQQAVADKARALKDAQAEQARVAQQNAQQIAAAQQRIADAQANVANAQQQAADQAASAQRQLQQAQLSAAGGADAAATAQAKYRQELAKLSPSARDTFNAFINLRSAFSAWSRALQPAVMPIFTRALVGLRNTLPTLTPFVLAAADAVKGLQDRFSRQIKTPFWQGFKRDLQTSVKPAITGLGVAFGNVITGMAGIVDAFLPHMDGISGGLQRITGRFADWGKSLKGSPAFERFLGFAADKAPLIGDALGKIAGAVLAIGEALAPVSGPLLQVIGTLAQSVGWLAQHAPELVIAIYGLFVATKLWTAWQIIANGAVEAFNLIMAAGPWGWIVLAIGALVLAVIYMYNHFAWFRAGVQAVWDWLKTATLWLWNTILKPTFEAIGAIVVWLWKNVIHPVFTGLIVPVFRALAGVVVWLWKNVVSPHFHFIAAIIVWWYKAILKPQFDAAVGIIRVLADAFRWLYDKVIKPVWQKGIAPVITDAWRHQIKPAFDALRSAASHLGDAFKGAATAIAKGWAQIRKSTKDPINFVIGTVWNDGIVSIWKKIGGWIPGLPKLGKLPLLAQGGALPVRPGVFNKPTAIVGEGRSQHPEYVIPTDPRYRQRALALWQAAGGQLMADGGILGDIVGGVKSFGGKIGGFFKSATSFLTNPGKALDGLLGKLLQPLNGIKDTGWGKLSIGLPKLIFTSLKDVVTGGGSGVGGPIGGVIPKGKRLSIINQALAAAHVPPPGVLGQWQAGLNTLITRESGWNPNAINRWDSNAKAGHPSQGLAQTIPGTFNHYVPASLRSRGILDPVANVAAAIRYIVATYGNITRVQQANANRPPAGYDSGGWMPPGMNLMYNGLGQPEAVLTPNQWSAIHGAATRGSDGAQQPVVVELHAKEGALGDFIDVRVQEHQQQLIQVINAS